MKEIVMLSRMPTKEETSAFVANLVFHEPGIARGYFDSEKGEILVTEGIDSGLVKGEISFSDIYDFIRSQYRLKPMFGVRPPIFNLETGNFER